LWDYHLFIIFGKKVSEKVRWDESSRNCDFFLENDSYRKKGYKNNYKK